MLADRERNDSSAKIAPLTPNGSHMKVTKKQLFGIPEPSILTKKRSTETPKLNDTYDDNIDIQLLDRLLTAHSLGPMDLELQDEVGMEWIESWDSSLSIGASFVKNGDGEVHQT